MRLKLFTQAFGRGEATRIAATFANKVFFELPHPYDIYCHWGKSLGFKFFSLLVGYWVETPGVDLGNNATVRLDVDNEVEYVVWRVYDEALDWFQLQTEKFWAMEVNRG